MIHVGLGVCCPWLVVRCFLVCRLEKDWAAKMESKLVLTTLQFCIFHVAVERDKIACLIVYDYQVLYLA